MKTLTFLEPEIADKIDEVTSKFINQNPINKLLNLKRIFETRAESIEFTDEQFWFDYETGMRIRDIIENHPEQILLHFATYEATNKSHASFVTPISDEMDCITTIRKYKEAGPSAVVSYLKRKDSNIQFDLTLVDTYDLDYEDKEEPYVMSYLYGNPYDEDWQHSQKTEFKAIADAIENNE